MSKAAVTEQDLSHAQCNGKLEHDAQSMPEQKHGMPNGIHLLMNKPNLSCTNEVGVQHGKTEKITLSKKGKDEISEEYKPAETEKSETNRLIDEFSTALALSLVRSSDAGDLKSTNRTLEKLENTNISVDIAKPFDESATTNPAETKVDNSSLENESKPTIPDTNEVVYPVSKITVNAGQVVAEKSGIKYLRYENEHQMSAIMRLITKDLSEPYSIYTYRYFIHNWPHLCFLAMHESTHVGAIVCKLDLHKKITRRGYIAMLAVDQSVRRRNIGTSLVKMAIEAMNEEGCDEVVLETEVTNKPALKLYENLGFVRDKRLFRYYLNGVDALRLKLWLR